MSRKPLGTIAVAVTIALAASGLVAAIAGAAHEPSLRPERITLRGVTVNGVDQPIHANATGPIAGHGTAEDNDKPNGTGVLVVSLPRGRVSIANKAKSVKATPNPQLCTATIIERGTFKIIGGTHRYAHASGRGTYTDHRELVGMRSPDGTCAGRNAPLKAIHNTVVLTGKAAISAR